MMLENRIISIVVVAVSAILYWFTLQMPEGPARFPKLLLVSLVILAALLFLTTFWRRDSNNPAVSRGQSVSVPEPGSKDKGKGIKVISILVVLGGYIALISTIGYIISTLLATLTVMLIMGERKLTRLVVVPVATSLILYVAFANLLRVPLPKGFFWF